MEEKEEFKTYLSILIESLEKKEVILNNLLTFTKNQSAVLDLEEESDIDEFEHLIDKKAKELRELELLDNGFELIYEKLRGDFPNYKDGFQHEILYMQELIAKITDKSVKLQTLEMDNKHRLEVVLSEKRSKIKNFKVSNKTAARYYKNMSGDASETAHFMDKRK